MELTDLMKGLGGLKSEIMADVQKSLEAAKNGSEGTVKDIEKSLQAKVDAKLADLEKSSEEVKQAIEKSETEFKRQIMELENNGRKDISLSAMVTKALMDRKDDLSKAVDNPRAFEGIELIKTADTMTVANSIAGVGGGAATAIERFAIDNNKLIEPLARRSVHVRNIFGIGASDEASFPYLVEKATDGGVGVQNPEAATKSQIEHKFELETTLASTIAAVQIAGKQTLRNVRGLATLVQALMLNDLLIKEDDELLNGTNTNGRVRGVIPVASAVTGLTASITSPQNYDVIAATARELAKSDIAMDFAMLNPADYWDMVLTKDKDENYLQNIIFDARASQLFVFGIPVFATTAIAAGSYLAGASRYVMPMQYQGISLRIDETGQTNIKNNTVTIRVEEEILQAVTKPGAFYAGTLAAAKAAITPAT